MIAFFGIVAVVGLMAVLLDFAAMANDPTPSLYRSGVTSIGFTLMLVGAIGAGCVYLVP